MGQSEHSEKRPPRRAVLASVVVLAVVLIAGGVVATMSIAGSAGTSLGVGPPPTRTPERPAIMIASSTNQDLPGSWLMQADGEYLLFSSTAFGNNQDNVPVLTGTPGHWSAAVDALPIMPSWAVPIAKHGTTWEPEVHQFGSTFVLYFSAIVAGLKPATHCLGTAVADSAVGPYTPTSRPIVCQKNQGGDIDPQVVMDDTVTPARPYLVWKSDNNNTKRTGTDRIWSQPLTADGMAVVGSPTIIYGTDQAPSWAVPILEAPQMVRAPNGSLWLFYSGGDGFAGPEYAIGVAKCAGISGPCTPVGFQPLISDNAQGVGPGEESIFQTGTSTWVLYNPWHANIPYRWFRPVAAARIGWTGAGPYVAEAGTFPPTTDGPATTTTVPIPTTSGPG